LAGYFALPRWQEKNNRLGINRFSNAESWHFEPMIPALFSRKIVSRQCRVCH